MCLPRSPVRHDRLVFEEKQEGLQGNFYPSQFSAESHARLVSLCERVALPGDESPAGSPKNVKLLERLRGGDWRGNLGSIASGLLGVFIPKNAVLAEINDERAEVFGHLAIADESAKHAIARAGLIDKPLN